MKKNYVFALVLVLCLAVTAFALLAQQGGGNGNNAAATPPAGPNVGATIADFRLPDTNGREHSLNSLKGENGTVLIFVSVQCPISNAYNERMARLAADYRARGINVVGINPNAPESVDAVRRHATENNLTFTILKDNGNRIADQLGAQVTPEVYFLDANNRLVYRGRIDNSRNPANANTNDLREALDAALAGRPVTRAYVPAFGCTIKRA